jgi:DNA-binding transcriptional LysR family regulator
MTRSARWLGRTDSSEKIVDSRELESFIATVEKGSISRAAAFLGLSQPAVSKHISKLEEELGTELLVRGHVRSMLTRQGEVVYRYALQVLELQRAVRKEIAEVSEDVEGLVRLSASSIPGDFLLPELLVRFRRSYPRIEVEVAVSDTKQALSDLMERRADLAVVGAERNLPGLVSTHFFTDELVLLCPREHPLAKRDSILQKDLVGQELVGRIDGSGTRSVLEEALRNEGLMLPSSPLRFSHAAALVKAVAAGGGVAVISSLAVPPGDHLVARPFAPPLLRPFFFVHGSLAFRPVRTLVEFLRQEVKTP